MWLLALHASAAEPDPAWVESTVAAWTALPAEARIDALRAMVDAAEDDRRAQLIALGRLEQAWPDDGPAEAHAAYVRELLLADDAGRRSYLVAAAGFGGALDADGQPTIDVEDARTLYAERRLAPGVVAWIACSGPDDQRGLLEAAGGQWKVGELEAYRDARKPTVGVGRFGGRGAWHCGEGRMEAGGGLGWTLFEGTRPLILASALDGGPKNCEQVRLHVETLTLTDANGVPRGGSGVTVEMPPRMEDCGAKVDWMGLAAVVNAQIVADLRLEAVDVADLDRSPSTLAGFRACGAKRPSEKLLELCAIE